MDSGAADRDVSSDKRKHVIWSTPFRTMKRYYLEGGDRFYAIGLPVSELAALLRENHMDMQCEDLKTSFFRHADYILERGTSYPLHEVNFEQSIVAPGTSCLLQAYQISGEERYLEEAKRQLKLLDQFNGQQAGLPPV